MNLHEARQALRGRFQFGNEQQIKAVRFLEEVERCKETIRACEYFKDHENDGWEDDPEGRDEFGKGFWDSVRACVCSMQFKQEVLDGALYELTGELYR